MAHHFMLYWRPETVEQHLACDFLLRNAGSNQLHEVQAGDVLWIVTTGEADTLGLAGRLSVGEVVSLAEAQKLLGTNDLWPSRYHALATQGTAEPMRGIGLVDIADYLTLADNGASRLTVRDGSVQLEELRKMRVLSGDSAALLEQVWSESTPMRERSNAKRSRS